MEAKLNMKITIFLFLLITTAIIPTNGDNITFTKNRVLDWNKEYYFCGDKFLRVVSHICNSEPYKGISEEFYALIRQYRKTCCSYTCSLNSLKIFCDDNRNSGAILFK
uniref:Insulin-like domain-containing protein n=1 Tax=Sipha flava TaxID=143950 RepID=A0A2S2R197_9HEMI